jgi:hypothetical protein
LAIRRHKREAAGLRSSSRANDCGCRVSLLSNRGERDHAALARERAEVLVDFIWNDLQSKLTEIGRVDLLESVNERLLKHFETLERSGEAENKIRASGYSLRLIHCRVFLKGDVSAARGYIQRSQSLRQTLLHIKDTDEISLTNAGSEENNQEYNALGRVFVLRSEHGGGG